MEVPTNTRPSNRQDELLVIYSDALSKTYSNHQTATKHMVELIEAKKITENNFLRLNLQNQFNYDFCAEFEKNIKKLYPDVLKYLPKRTVAWIFIELPVDCVVYLAEGSRIDNLENIQTISIDKNQWEKVQNKYNDVGYRFQYLLEKPFSCNNTLMYSVMINNNQKKQLTKLIMEKYNDVNAQYHISRLDGPPEWIKQGMHTITYTSWMEFRKIVSTVGQNGIYWVEIF